MYWTKYTLFHISYLTTSLTWTTITRTWCDLIATIILKTKSFIETQLHVRTKKYSALGNKPRSPVHMFPTLTNELCELLLKDFKAQNNRIQNKFHIHFLERLYREMLKSSSSWNLLVTTWSVGGRSDIYMYKENCDRRLSKNTESLKVISFILFFLNCEQAKT